jgi:O-antigen/teichoic acid export membrane protein
MASRLAGRLDVGRWLPASFARNVLVLAMGEGGVMALNIVTGVLLARGLGPEGRGAYLAITFWPVVLGWCATLALPGASAYLRAKAPDRAGGLLANALVAVLVLGGALALGGALVLPHLLPQYPPAVVRMGQWMLLGLPAFAFIDVCQGILQGAARFRLVTCARVLTPLIQGLGLGTLFAAGLLHVGTAALVLAASVITVTLLLILAIGAAGEIGRPDRALLVETGRYAIRSYPAVLANIGLSAVDQIMLIPVLSPVDLGLYVVATRAFLLARVPAAASQVLFAAIPTLPGHQGRALAGRTLAVAALATGIVGLGLGASAPTLVSVLFGEAFLPSVPAFRVLLLGAVASGLAGITAESLAGLGKPLLTSVTRIGTLAAMVLGLWALVPSWGMIGASWAVTLANCLGFALAGTFLWRQGEK